jgi:hypothetical protein
MPKMQKKWVKLKGQKKGKPRYGLRCEKCGNRLMMVIEEPVSRQQRSNTAGCPTLDLKGWVMGYLSLQFLNS